MDKGFNERLVFESTRIADRLINDAKCEANGISWRTLQYAYDKKLDWGKSKNIFNGSSGIILFFISLYKKTPDPSYLDIIIKAADWTADIDNEEMPSRDFYTGKLGVAYVLFKVYEVLKEEIYKTKALKIINECRINYYRNPTFSLIDGDAGVLLGLLFAYSISKEDWILNEIINCANFIIKHGNVNSQGLNWGKNQLKGLCGFAEGNSGIAYVFLILAEYFNSSTFFWIAHQAIKYENNNYEIKFENWPDLRESQKFEILKKDKVSSNFLIERKDIVAWSHGSPGIGITRLKAREISSVQEYNEDILFTINKVQNYLKEIENNIRPSFNLYYGYGGIALYLIKLFQYYKDDKFLSLSKNLAIKAFNQREKYDMYFSNYHSYTPIEDNSFFMGTAGIGYFYLKLIDSNLEESILDPDSLLKSLSKDSFNNFLIKPKDLSAKIVSNLFPKTVAIYCHSNKIRYFDFSILFSIKTNLMTEIISKINKLVLHSENPCLQDVFEFELAKLKFKESIQNKQFIEQRKKLKMDKFLSRINNKESNYILNLSFIPSEEIIVYYTKWNWSDEHSWIKNISANSSSYKSLLFLTSVGIQEYLLTDFDFLVYSLIKKYKKIAIVLKYLLKELGANNLDLELHYKDKLISLLKQWVQGGVLIYQNYKPNLFFSFWRKKKEN